MAKKIIVIGSGRSGSGAVFDYLAGRPDIIDPLKEREFRLVQDPGGIMDLHHAIGEGFTVNTASAAIQDFISLCKRLERSKKSIPPGLNYGSLLDDFMLKVNRYILDIIDIKYKGLPACEVAKLPFIKALKVSLVRRFQVRWGKKPQMGKMYLPVQEELFLIRTKQFISELFFDDDRNDAKKPVVINQGGSFWNPVSSTQYYGERHIIIVTRDPRDIYAGMKVKGYAYPGNDVEVFCKWFNNIMKRVNREEWKSDLVTHIEFEKFVSDYGNNKYQLDQLLDLDPAIGSEYSAEMSKRNIGKYKSLLSSKEKAIIEQELSQYFIGL